MTEPTEDLFDISTETGWPATTELPPPSNPMSVARELIKKTNMAGVTSWWRGDFYQWRGTHWEPWPDAEVLAWLYRSTEHATYVTKDPKNGDRLKVVPWAPTKRRIADLKEALAYGVLQRDSTKEPDDGGGFVAFTNGVLDLATMELLPHTPERFNLHHLAVPYELGAVSPRWLRFLGQVLEDDPERIAILQEWFGYILCGGTELQKMLTMFGPKRCGKGTILRILAALVGRRYVASPSTLDSLAGTFGLEALLGKRLAIFGDVQWAGSHVGEAVGLLLGISGEDSITVQRKHRTAWNGTLPVRFTLAGNDRPKFRNASGALPGRMIYLQFRVSMFGREDPTLTDQLLAELSGIFNWALVGWNRLCAQGGKFTESQLAKKAAEEVERSSAPVTAFVRDMCVTEDEVDQDVLYREYEKWRAREGLGDPLGKPSFSRDLQSALPMLGVERRGRGAGRHRMYIGIRLRHDAEGDDDSRSGDDEGVSPSGCTRHVPGMYPALPLDLQGTVSAGPGSAVPGVPGVPSISPKNRSTFSTSAESTSSADVRAAIGEVPGTSGYTAENRPLTSANAVPGIFGDAGYTFSPELWDGDPLIEPPDAA